MQVSQTGDKIVRRVGVEEEHIKFRPSPNFKNMKKFLKSRSDYSETTTLASNKILSSPVIEHQQACEPVETKEKKPVVLHPQVTTTALKPVVVQPPLPPYPPPVSPPLNVTIKQERKDEEEEDQNNSGGEGELSQEEAQPTIIEKQQDTEQNQARPRKTMCKEFIRGNCKRPICKYAHEVDVSQLAGVFTFCWNYQNDVCNFPNCRFVHASVFEEAEFYRTGVLPPHALSHLKKQQAPPPPPPDETQSHPEIRPASFANPPPQPHTSVDPVEEFKITLPRSTSPLKREWAEIEDFNTSPRELEPNEHMAKKCKNCEIMEFRYNLQDKLYRISVKYNKEMRDNMKQSSAEISKKIGLINKKNKKLYSVLYMLFKASNKQPRNNGLLSGGEIEKMMQEEIKTFFGSSHSFSSLNDDENMMGGGIVSLPSLMVKLLCGGVGEETLPIDTSRET